MKFGDRLAEESVQQWQNYNLDYSQIKRLIKVSTTPGNGNAIAVPGHEATHDRKREDELFTLLLEECTHADHFTRSKRLEAVSRLASIERKLADATKRNGLFSSNLEKNLRARQRYCKLENDTIKAGREIDNIRRFSAANKTAVRKLVKKYRKWSGSATLDDRVDEDILGKLDSFSTMDLQPVSARQSALIARVRQPFVQHNLIRLDDESIDPLTHPLPIITTIPIVSSSTDAEATPAISQNVSPTSTLRGEELADSALASSQHTPRRQKRQRRARQVDTSVEQPYWNEYDHPDSESGGEFAIYVDPDAPWFPGQKAVAQFYAKLLSLISRKLELHRLSLDTTSSDEEDNEREALVNRRARKSYGTLPASYHSRTYANFHHHVEASVVPDTSTLCLLASVLLLIVSAFLTFTSRHKLRGEVDVAVVVAVISLLAFAVVGIVRWWTVERDARRIARGELMDTIDVEAQVSMRERFSKVFTCVNDVLKVAMFCAVCIGSGALVFALFK